MNDNETPINLEKRIKRHIKAKNHSFFAIVTPGFEETCLKELNSFGINSPLNMVKGGIEFSGKIDICYKVNLLSRTITRVLLRLFDFKATNFRVLLKKVLSFHWELYFSSGMSINFKIDSSHSRLYHTGGIEEDIKDGIEKRLKEYNIDVVFNTNPESMTIFVRFENDRCQISLDTTGIPLYKRGYKTLVSYAPLRENIAASILLEADIKNTKILIDPMCGSGTFTLEACGIREYKIPGIDRTFAFETFPFYSKKTFEYLKRGLLEEAKRKATKKSEKLKIFMGDIDKKMVEIANENLKRSDAYSTIEGFCKDFFDNEFPNDNQTLLVLNPPYGKRIVEENIINLYTNIDLMLKKKYFKTNYAVMIPSSITSKVNIPYTKRIKLNHGGIPVDVRIRLHTSIKIF